MYKRQPLASLLDALSPPQILCGGRVDPVSAAMADARGLILRDYFAREELAVANAVPTAEGAVQLAMEQMPVTIHGARVLITGFGRVGQAAARRFAALGARVSVAARRYEQLALAESEGYGAEPVSYTHLLSPRTGPNICLLSSEPGRVSFKSP